MRSKTERPAPTYTTSPVTNLIRRAALVLLGAGLVLTMLRYPTLPETIPTHYNLAGEVDGWSGRWSVLLMAGLTTVLVIGMTLASRHPRVFNYPREVTEDNAQAIYKAGEEFMVWLTAAVSVLMCGILLIILYGDSAWVAENGGGAVGIWGTLGVFAVVIAGIVHIMRA